MKRFILLLLLTSLMAFQTKNPTTKIIYGETFEVMNGNVKQLTSIEGNFSRIQWDTINFNKKGEIIDIRSRNSEGKNYHILYSYRYDHNGKPKEIFTNSIGYSKGKFVYGNGSYITEDITYNPKGDVWGKGLYKYDTFGNVIEYSFSSTKGDFALRIKYKYDKKHITEETTGGGALVFNKFYQYKTYDSKNNWTQLVKTTKESSGISGLVHADTVHRQITYY